ncbi:hypothetical protein BP6252_09823 [Coleophoma cylindrospora]|uniref:Origin recognition complex subunit 1 n=1 Tax=Coleophoma cylindrospora TaxID=1849047 RepID=A0A3D8QWW3_9HELO|nr:hypothetical protein BP6252_09823 [Coleophoma cylindrospora]
MPHRTAASKSPDEQARKARETRKYLSGAAPTGNDSEAELEADDHQWQWVYREGYEQEGNAAEEESDDDATAKSAAKSRRSSRHVTKQRSQNIVAARRAGCEYRIGDCVRLRAEGINETWVGIICNFDDDDPDEKAAAFMWFSSEKEIKPLNKYKKRTDFLENELYITPSTDPNPLESIIDKANIMSEKIFNENYPTGKVPKKSSDYDEFNWEELYQGGEAGKDSLLEWVKEATAKTTRKRRLQKQDDENGFEPEDEPESTVQTPRKRQKFLAATPTKIRSPSKLLTPSHRKVVIKKALEITPLGTRFLSPGHTQASPFQTARSKLHVSSVPTSLPCREDEFGSVYSHLEAAITDGSGACIYISGTPGTGKTATVREVVAQLNASVMADELDDFIFVEINGMKVTDPHQSYSLLWEALKGDRVSPTHALDLLEREFNHPSPRRVPCVVLMDELDQLVTKNQSVMYNFFNWPGLRHSRLIVLAVANTMDLPERTLSNKISSRLGLTRITFPGYTHEQLMKIIQSRLEGVPGNIVDPDAVQFASRKVAAVSGDARRALDICRRAVELAEAESVEAGIQPGTPSKTGKSKSVGQVTIATIKRAINEATTSPLQQYLRSLPFASKVLLAALLTKTRQTGLAESVMGDVLDKAKQMAKMDTGSNMIEHLLRDKADGSSRSKSSQQVGSKGAKIPRVLAMGTSAVDLMDAGIIGLEARRADRTGKVRLNIGEEDVRLAFKDDPDIKNLGFSV